MDNGDSVVIGVMNDDSRITKNPLKFGIQRLSQLDVLHNRCGGVAPLTP